jgi:cation diffusion facilitator family transporter
MDRAMQKRPRTEEEKILAISILATIIGAAAGIGFGLLSRSRSITFDGFYELTDAAMTGMALLVAGLIARGADRRFQFGYWHFEPLMMFLNGVVLALACIYAGLDALNGLLSGGRLVSFDVGAIYLALTGLLSLIMLILTSRAAKRTASQLVAADARSWLMGTLLSAGMLVSFIAAMFLADTELAFLGPYLDPAILLLVAALLLPFPLAMVWRAGKELLLVAPADLDQRVTAIVKAVAEKHGFPRYTSYVLQSGRQQFVDVTFIAASSGETRSFGALDAIRSEIAEGLGKPESGYWLTVDFTADERWD